MAHHPLGDSILARAGLEMISLLARNEQTEGVACWVKHDSKPRAVTVRWLMHCLLASAREDKLYGCVEVVHEDVEVHHLRLVLTRDPVADRIGVVVAALTRTRRGLASELVLTVADGVPTDSVVNFDNIHTIARQAFRRQVATLSPARMADVCRTLQAATGC